MYGDEVRVSYINISSVSGRRPNVREGNEERIKAAASFSYVLLNKLKCIDEMRRFVCVCVCGFGFVCACVFRVRVRWKDLVSVPKRSYVTPSGRIFKFVMSWGFPFLRRKVENDG